MYEYLYRKFYIDLDLKPDPTNDEYDNITIGDMINSAITALQLAPYRITSYIPLMWDMAFTASVTFTVRPAMRASK